MLKRQAADILLLGDRPETTGWQLRVLCGFLSGTASSEAINLMICLIHFNSANLFNPLKQPNRVFFFFFAEKREKWKGVKSGIWVALLYYWKRVVTLSVKMYMYNTSYQNNSGYIFKGMTKSYEKTIAPS